ncbi:MAG: hypothetical protein WCO56_03820 [Verrucomicrobiota bacterium]
MKWLIVGAAGAAAGVLTVVGFVAWAWIKFDEVPAQYRSLPVYVHDQTDSTHPWHRRSTATCGTAVYVHDFEESSLLLQRSPTNAIGRAPIGNALVCAIEGQSPQDYLAVDCGSEMPAFEVFRNAKRPPFDFRRAKFQALECSSRIGRTEHKRATDPALIAEVVRTLSDGTPTAAELPATMESKNISGLRLFSDELPGLMFCPHVYQDRAGTIYLAESLGQEFVNRTVKFHARWIPAGPLFTQWVQTP